jgi:hypothetical protein
VVRPALQLLSEFSSGHGAIFFVQNEHHGIDDGGRIRATVRP